MCQATGEFTTEREYHDLPLYTMNSDPQDTLYDNTTCLKKMMKSKEAQSQAWFEMIRGTISNLCFEQLPMPTLLTIKNDNTKELGVTLTYGGCSEKITLAADENRQFKIKQYFPEYKAGMAYTISGSLGLGRSTKSIWITPNYPKDVALFTKDIFGTTLILNPK